MTQPADILVLTRHYAPEPIGSAPVIRQLAMWLAANRGPVDVVTVRPSYPYARIFEGYETGAHDDAVEDGVHVRRKPTSVMAGGGMAARLVPEAEFALRLAAGYVARRIRGYGTVISLCPSILTVAVAPLFRSGAGRHVAIVHDIQSGLAGALKMGGPARAVLSILRWLERTSLNRADHLICLSEEMAAQVRALGVRTPIAVLPPHVDTEAITPRPERSGPFTVMYSGNLGRKQGLGTLVNVATRLARRDPSIRMLIRGNGNMEDWLRGEIARRNLSNVTLEPLAPVERLSESLADGHMHLVPQDPDGADFAVPSKVFALMAAGRTFICSAASGSPLDRLRAASDDIFACVPPGEDDALTDAILALKDAPEIRCIRAARGRAYAEIHASTETVMRQLAARVLRSGTDADVAVELLDSAPRSAPVDHAAQGRGHD